MNHGKRTALILASACVAAVAALTACGSEDPGDEPLRCDNEPRGMDYAPGMVVVGRDGSYAVALVSADPAPPDQGDNSWVVEVRDPATDAAVADAVLTPLPFMPDHGHGTPITPEVAPGDGPSEQVIDRINLWMPGLWEVRIGVDVAGTTDQATFAFCIEG